MDKVGVAMLAVVLFLAGIGGTTALFVVDHYAAVEGHEQTDATVVSTSVEVNQDDDAGTRYRPEVVYEYRVDGEYYLSERVYPSSSDAEHENREDAEAVIGEYEPGENVTAYYDTSDPSQTYLRNPGPPWALVGTSATGAVAALLAGCWFVVTGYRRRETWNEQHESGKSAPAASEEEESASSGEEESTASRRWAVWRLPVGVVLVCAGLVLGAVVLGPLVGIPIPILF